MLYTKASDALPDDARFDPMGPPVDARDVWCLHCQAVFSSEEMVYDDESELWLCPRCRDGAGYGLDIHDVMEGDGHDEWG